MVKYELNIQDYLRIIRKRRLVIIVTFCVFAIASLFYSASQPPVYEADATIKIQERKTVAGLLTEFLVYSPGDIMETQTKTIKSFAVMKNVALKLELIAKDTPLEKVNEVVGSLQGRISTEKVGTTNIIRIGATSNKPKEAMDLANAVAAACIEENLLEKNKEARTTRQFIEEQIATLEKKLSFAEDKQKNFGEDVRNITISEDMDKRLSDLQFQLANLLQKYTEKHPKVLTVKEQIAGLENQLKGFSGKELEYARLKREVEVNRKIYGMLREKLEEVRITEAEKVSDISMVDPALLPQSPINTKPLFNLLLGGILGLVVSMTLAFVAESLDTSISTIEDVEASTKLPVLGVVPPIAYEKELPATYFERLKARFIARKISDEEKKYVRLISHHQPTSPIAESFRNLKTNIKFSPTRKVILVTSSGPQEGKTSVVTNLGLVCAQDGIKTLLISSDVRRPAIAESFNLPKKPGLNEVIMGSCSLDDALKGVSDMIVGDMGIEGVLKQRGLEYLWILPSGSSVLNPTEILDSKELDNLIDICRSRFDVVIFDSPPVLPVADASIIAPKVDGVVLCYEIGKTSREALLRAKSQLETAKANILGIVLNHISTTTQVGDIYPYYYKYYGKEEQKGHHKKTGK